ncbi:MAG: amidoligase family protein [Clostridium sp.]|nr:amidoligase family protein [Clostridium sp.]
MKNQTIGVEIEMTGITKAEAAEVVVNFLGGRIEREYDGYDTYNIIAPDQRIWKVMNDASIKTMKNTKGKLKAINNKDYSVELVTPILRYEDIETLQELIRRLRKAGAVSESALQCGIHIHIGAKNHTPNTLKNLVNLMAAKEDLIYKSLEIDPARVRWCKKVNEDLIQAINKKKPKTLEQLADLWYSGYGFENRERHYHTSRLRSYIVFSLAISHQALTQKSASGRRTYTDNEKYTFRCWLLRLGLIGEEFKNCRMHLMKALDGNSAWRNPNAA